MYKEIIKKGLKEIEKSKSNNVLDFTMIKKMKEKENEIESMIKKVLDNEEYDPSHKLYLSVLNTISFFAEELSGLEEFRAYTERVISVQKKFTSNPKAPLMNSYFSLWSYFDLIFGKDSETIGKIFKELAVDNEFEEIFLKVLDNLNSSYTGFYLQIGIEDDFIILKEFITDKTYNCIIPSGYKGKKNDIWYVRLAKNLDPNYNYYVALNTPYIILNTTEQEWKDFFKSKRVAKKRLKKFLRRYDEYWYDYIIDNFHSSAYENVFLDGVPESNDKKVSKKINYKKYNISIGEKVDRAINDAIKGNINKGKKNIKKIFEQYPDDSIVLYGMGMISHIEEKDKDSITYFNKAIEINPNLEFLWYNKAVVHISLNEISNGIASYEKFLTITRDSILIKEVKNSLSEIKKHIRDDFNLSVSQFLKIIKNNKIPIKNYDKYNKNILINDYIIILENLLLNQKKDKYLWMVLATSYAQIDARERAIECFNQVIRIDPDFEQAIEIRDLLLSFEPEEKFSSWLKGDFD